MEINTGDASPKKQPTRRVLVHSVPGSCQTVRPDAETESDTTVKITMGQPSCSREEA